MADVNEAWQHMKPERVVLIVSIDKNGKPDVMPAGWCMHTSGVPSMLAVSVGHTRYTHKLINQTKEFVIALPNKDMIDIINFTGSCSGRDTDKFKEANIKTEKSKIVKCPLIADATINFECKLINQCESGDHTIFVGEILETHMDKKKGVVLNFGNGVFKEVKK